MPNEWPRFAHGKLVKAPDGEIIGPDYTTLGRTAAPPFPEVTRAVQPDTLGLPGLESGSAYPDGWAAHGAMLLRPASTASPASSQPWYLITRYRLVEEYPGKPDTRSYALSMTVAVSPQELDFPVLFQLSTRVGIEQFTAKNLNLPPLAIPAAAPVPLPAGWFDRVRPWLVAIASGRTFGSHEPDTPIDGFLEQALWAVACLPGAIRWRVPVAAGVFTVPPADRTQLVYALTLSHRPRAASTADTGAGEAYADWFAGATNNGTTCQTVQEVLEAVRRGFPDLDAWNAIQPTDDWRQAVKAIGELKDLNKLQEWAARPTGTPPPLDPINLFRQSVLKLTEKHLSGPPEVRAHLLSGVTAESWKPAWQAYAKEMKDTPLIRVGELVGPLPFSAASLAQGARAIGDLPDRLAAKARERLIAAYPKTLDNGIAAWGGLIRQAFAASPPAWFSPWATANAPQLAWGAAALQLNMGEQTPTAAWTDASLPPAAEAMKAMLESNPPGKGFDDLLPLAKQFPKLAAGLTDHVEGVAFKSAYRLAVTVGYQKWLGDRMQSTSPPQGLLDVAIEQCEAKDSDARWAAMLVKHWEQVARKPEARNALLDLLVENRWRPANWQDHTRKPGRAAAVLTRLGELVGQSPAPPFHPDTLEWVLTEPTDLPVKVRKVALDKLTKAFEKVTDGGYGNWAEMIGRAFAPSQPGWFSDWAKPNAVRLAWAAASLRLLSDPPVDPTAGWQGPAVPPAAAAMRAMLRREPPWGEWAALLTLAKEHKKSALALAKHLEAYDSDVAWQLANESDNEDWVRGSVSSGSVQQFEAFVQRVVRGDFRTSEQTLRYLLENWDRHRRPDQELRQFLRPHLGVAERILVDTSDPLSTTDGKVADWVWPILKTLTENNRERRERVLKVAAKTPGLVRESNRFKTDLLNPVLYSADIRQLAAAGGPILQFALDLRDGVASELPQVELDEVWPAELWKPVLGRAKTKRPLLLRSPAQLPIALWYSDHIELRVDNEFWKSWFAFLTQPVQPWYLNLLRERGLIDRSLIRFADGWDKVKALRPDELRVISSLGLKADYSQAANAGGAANALPVDFVIDSVAMDQFCPDPQWWRHYFEQALKANDPVVVGCLWVHCVRKLAEADAGAVKEMKDLLARKSAGAVKKAWSAVSDLVARKPGTAAHSDWFQAAREVIESDRNIAAYIPTLTHRLQSYL